MHYTCCSGSKVLLAYVDWESVCDTHLCVIFRIQSETADVIDLTLDSDRESPMKAERYYILCICAWLSLQIVHYSVRGKK